MSFADVQNKTNIDTQFSEADRIAILATMNSVYVRSDTAKAMFDSWIAVPGNTILINFGGGKFGAYANTGKLVIDLNNLTSAMYIDNNGTAVKDTVVTAIVHELVHALTGRLDDGTGAKDDRGTTTDYEGATVTYSNIIYKELGIPEQNSYIAYDDTGILTLGFQYTNGAAIDRSFVRDDNWDSSGAGNSNDLLIGGASGNELIAGDGNDFLYGNGGSDTLEGGIGSDKLIGGSGSDTLNGGDGSDTYVYKTGDGSDTITDTDGKGSIQYDGTGLSGGIGGDAEGEVKKATAGGTFKSSDDIYTYSWGGDGSDLTVNGNITVKNFHNGDLGITLYSRNKKAPDPIPDSVADAINRARSAVQRFGDPLTLDLNGNGIETVPLKRPPLLFDINASGIKISTGWIAPSDGLLVLDRNGNGIVDSGAELFGDVTPAYATGTTHPSTSLYGVYGSFLCLRGAGVEGHR